MATQLPPIRTIFSQYVQAMAALNCHPNSTLLHLEMAGVVTCATYVARHAAGQHGAVIFTQQNLDDFLDDVTLQYNEIVEDIAENGNDNENDNDSDNDNPDEDEPVGDVPGNAQNPLADLAAAFVPPPPQVQAPVVLPPPPQAVPHPPAPATASAPPATPTPESATARHGTTGCTYLDTMLERPPAEFQREFSITQEAFDYAVDRLQSSHTLRTSRKHQRTIPIQLAAHLLRRRYTTHTVAFKLSISEASVSQYRKRVTDVAQELGVDLNELLLHHG